MTPLSVAYVATAAICAMVGLQHLLLALRVEDRRTQLLFSIAAFAVAGDAVMEPRTYFSESAEAFLAGMPWTALFIAIAIVALSWFIALRTECHPPQVAVGGDSAGSRDRCFGLHGRNSLHRPRRVRDDGLAMGRGNLLTFQERRTLCGSSAISFFSGFC